MACMVHTVHIVDSTLGHLAVYLETPSHHQHDGPLVSEPALLSCEAVLQGQVNPASPCYGVKSFSLSSIV